MANQEDSLHVRVIRHALKYPQGFKYSDIIESKELNLKDWEKSIISRHFQDACTRYNYGENTKGDSYFYEAEYCY